MARFDHLKGVFGLLPTPYNEDYSIRTADLRAVADFCCRSGQHGIVWPVMVGEFYYLGRWMTPEFPVLIANSPDVYAFTMEDSVHYHHWAQNFADEAGYLRDPNHVRMKVDFCHQLGLTDAEIRSYQPLPETIAMTCTMLFYVRRSYEEGLAVLGYAGERVAAGSGYAKTLYEGLAKHYGAGVKNFEVHAHAEPDHGQKAADLFRQVAETRPVQDRCRDAVRNYLLVAESRVRAMNRWVE